MSLSVITTGQLEFLFASRNDSRVELLLRRGRDPTTGEVQIGFESADACRAEDENRARTLRDLPHNLWAKVPAADPERLAALLGTISKAERSKPTPSCSASAMYVRSRRIGVLGSILDFVREHSGLDVAWVTARHPILRFNPKERWSEICHIARGRLHHQLEISGAMAAPGFLMAHLNGCFESSTKNFRLHYRGIVAGEKLRCLDELRNSSRHGGWLPSGIDIRVHQLKNLSQQISGMMPNFLPELVLPSISEFWNVKRMAEPYHSIYLMWLAQHSLADMWVIDGVFYSDGRLVMRECYGASVDGGFCPVGSELSEAPTRPN